MSGAASVTAKALSKLEWSSLLCEIANFAQTEAGRDRCLGISPELDHDTVEDRWQAAEAIKGVVAQGYVAPIGELVNLDVILKGAAFGKIFNGTELYLVGELLDATRRVAAFAGDFADRCPPLRRVRSHLFPVPALLAEIRRAIHADGSLRDDASDKLRKIRVQKVGLRKRIEEKLAKLLRESEVEKYLQDDFFTVRSERYVVPIKLDGRGRVTGAILDTSDSGQTLFIEPEAVKTLNESLQELDLEEKLEILRIFRELSQAIEREAPILDENYRQLIHLDQLTAEARFADKIKAGRVRLASDPHLDLVNGRHPLLGSGEDAVPNTVKLDGDRRVLILSGPNAGGKTVVLKTVGLLHLMAKAGLLLPADSNSSVCLFDNVMLEMGDAQDLAENLSTFSGHISGLKPIVSHATERTLVLLDELAVGTDPQTGTAIAQAILEVLAKRQVCTLVTTHLDGLKGMALKDSRFRNGSMEFSLQSYRPTYKLILDVPGQSYGIEVAEKMGLPERVINRAKELRGASVSTMDEAVNELMKSRDEARSLQQELKHAKLEAEAEQGRWRQECELLQEERRRAAEQLAEKYDQEARRLRKDLEDAIHGLRKLRREAGVGEVIEQTSRADKAMQRLDGLTKAMERASASTEEAPGRKFQRGELQPGMSVFVTPMKKKGYVLAIPNDDGPVEVEVGVLKMRVPIHELRLVDDAPQSRVNRAAAPSKLNREVGGRRDDAIGFVVQSPTNSVDVRGSDGEAAVRTVFDFIDKAMLRGEQSVVIIHGVGEGVLSRAVREALGPDCPYALSFRPGLKEEGGDGVTIVSLASSPH